MNSMPPLGIHTPETPPFFPDYDDGPEWTAALEAALLAEEAAYVKRESTPALAGRAAVRGAVRPRDEAGAAPDASAGFAEAHDTADTSGAGGGNACTSRSVDFDAGIFLPFATRTPPERFEGSRRRFFHGAAKLDGSPFRKRRQDGPRDLEDLCPRPQKRAVWPHVPKGQSSALAGPRCDREDAAGPGRERPFRPYRVLTVTDISKLTWCELQQYYARTLWPLRTTRAMEKGQRVHRQLEEEVHTMVPVSPRTKEDRRGLAIWNSVVALSSALVMGKTREVWVLGFLDGLGLVTGIIDGMERSEAGEWVLSDTKTTTNRRPFPPSWAAGNDVRKSNPGAVQLMIYKKLFDSLVDVAAQDQEVTSAWMESVCKALDVDPDKPLSAAFVAEMQGEPARRTASEASLASTGPAAAESPAEILELSEGLATTSCLEPAPPPSDSGTRVLPDEGQHIKPSDMTLRDLLRRMLDIAAFYPHASPEMRIEYVAQSPRQPSVGSTETFIYDGEILAEKLQRAEQFWNRTRPPEGVDVSEAGKCHVCQYAASCSWRKERAEAPLRQFGISLQDTALTEDRSASPEDPETPLPNPIPTSGPSSSSLP